MVERIWGCCILHAACCILRGMQYVWNLDPVAFSLFGLDVRWYGIVYVAGFYLALWWGWKLYERARRREQREGSLNQKQFENILFWIFVGGIIGGRLGHFVFFNPDPLLADPMEFFRVWHGGMSIQGGLIGSSVAILLTQLKRKKEERNRFFFQFSDALVLPLVLTLAFGRIANFVNGELVGVPTDSNWGVVFPHVDEVLRHPVVLYESVGHFLVFLDLLILYYFFPKVFRGRGFGLFLIGYGLIRFFVEPFKAYSAEVFLGLSMGQWLSLGMVLIGGIIFCRNLTKALK